MKILFFIDSLGSGGAQRQLITLVVLLKKKGYNPEVLCYFKSDFFLEILKKHDIKVHWLVIQNPIKRVITIRSFIRKNNYDSVISFLDTPDLLSCISSLGGHKWNIITSERSSRSSKFKTFKGLIVALAKLTSDVIVCNSYNARNLWLNKFPKYRDKFKVIYNTSLICSPNSKYIPMNKGKINIVVAASYQKIKNPIKLIKAVSMLPDKYKNKITINWYGENKLSHLNDVNVYNESVSLIKENKLEKIIKLNGPVNDIQNKMNKADFVGLFSELEGLPNAICEGMFLGKAIIMTKVSDYNTLVDSNNGVLCKENTVEAISNALVKILSMKLDEILRMGECSKRKYTELFSPQKVINQWIELIS